MTTYQPGDSSAERYDSGDGNATGHVAHPAHDGHDRMGSAMDPLRDKVRKIADQQKDAGAEQMESIAKAAHGAADDLERELPMAAEYIHHAASRLEQASARIRQGDIEQLVDACNDFARQRPAAFFGGAVLAGFALARFLKSSAPQANPDSDPRSY
ncbi:MAG: hypothetical protein ACM30I_14045 [Gemmatimonas sp.]